MVESKNARGGSQFRPGRVDLRVAKARVPIGCDAALERRSSTEILFEGAKPLRCQNHS